MSKKTKWFAYVVEKPDENSSSHHGHIKFVKEYDDKYVFNGEIQESGLYCFTTTNKPSDFAVVSVSSTDSIDDKLKEIGRLRFIQYASDSLSNNKEATVIVKQKGDSSVEHRTIVSNDGNLLWSESISTSKINELITQNIGDVDACSTWSGNSASVDRLYSAIETYIKNVCKPKYVILKQQRHTSNSEDWKTVETIDLTLNNGCLSLNIAPSSSVFAKALSDEQRENTDNIVITISINYDKNNCGYEVAKQFTFNGYTMDYTFYYDRRSSGSTGYVRTEITFTNTNVVSGLSNYGYQTIQEKQEGDCPTIELTNDGDGSYSGGLITFTAVYKDQGTDALPKIECVSSMTFTLNTSDVHCDVKRVITSKTCGDTNIETKYETVPNPDIRKELTLNPSKYINGNIIYNNDNIIANLSSPSEEQGFPNNGLSWVLKYKYKTSEKEETFEDIQTWTGIISRPQNVITP